MNWDVQDCSYIDAVFLYSDTMNNKGAFITLKGGDLTPKFTTYEAVVSIDNIIITIATFLMYFFLFQYDIL